MVELRVELLHADATGRVVRVTAHDGERVLGSCLGEAPQAEQAEDRAAARLLTRLGLADLKAQPLVASSKAGLLCRATAQHALDVYAVVFIHPQTQLVST